MDDDIKLLHIFRTLKREKLIIIVLTTLSTLIGLGYSFTKQPIFKGEFEIVVRDNALNNITTELKLKSLVGTPSSGNVDTQLLILKSPSVLLTVFNYVSNEYLKKCIKTSNMNYKTWL